MIRMNKKKVLIILSILILLVVIISSILFSGLLGEILSYLRYKVMIPKETITIEEQEHITITYTYYGTEEKFDIDVTNKEFISYVIKAISSNKLENYTKQIGLLIMGQYNVDLGNGISFKFDHYDDDGFVRMDNGKQNFLTKIKPEILQRIIEIVDVKLTQNIEKFKTQRVTISNESKKEIVNIEEKTATDYILERCKNIYTKEIDYEPNIVSPDYIIDFNNSIKLLIYKQNTRGWLLNDGFLEEAYGLNVFDTLLEYTFENIDEKRELFATNKLTITDPNKSIEITNKEIIEKITTPLIFSKLVAPEWIKAYDIAEEYNNGIKVRINDYEFLIPGKRGTVTIGNRYIIDSNKQIKLCFMLEDLEQYVNELLGNKFEKNKGTMTIAIP